MYFAENVLGRLFHSYAEEKQFSLVSEPRKRSRHQHLAYVKWMLGGTHKEISRAISTAYRAGESQSNFFSKLRFNKTASACGVTLVFSEQIGKEEIQYYFDYLRSRFTDLGYKLEHSYRELSDQTLYVETTDKYFLKGTTEVGRRKRSEGSHSNVTFEYICIDNKPSHCKVVLMTNGDKKYNPNKEFNCLMGNLFEF
jgi:hypothetical protein